MIKYFGAFFLLCTLNISFGQDLYIRGGIASKHYSSHVGNTNLTGFQVSLGTSFQSKASFNLDFSYFPINTQFYTGEDKMNIYKVPKDTLVNYSGKGLFSFMLSPYVYKLISKKNEFSFGLRFGINKAIGNRNNTLIEYDVKYELGSLSLGAFLEYHYYINHKHSLFLNGGADINSFGFMDNSPSQYTRMIIGLKPITGFINIGYAFVFIRA